MLGRSDVEADGLNNQGVSYFDLGRKEDAITCWEKALKINQMHPEATYNLSLIQWRDAKVADDEVLRRKAITLLKEIPPPSRWDYAEWRAV